MKQIICLILLALLCAADGAAQTENAPNQNLAQNSIGAENVPNQSSTDDELPRFEIGGHYTTLDRNGFGGRFTVNVNRSLALEAEGNFFPGERFDGRAAQGLFGIKAGKRFNKFGVFGKARPGFVYTSRGNFDYSLQNDGSLTIRQSGRTDFAFDVGGVLEFYPTKRIVTRFDVGDTITRTGSRTVNFPIVSGNTVTLQPFTIRANTRHNFQFSAGVGFRF